ncbi:hypothetical protein BU24DRAFT_453981 [Aaosphaeria arxii CBS 175.79]|uniref:DUF8021 domain-containing protein n=1 Tax=Aaosphaeria arxii CBS 175.79 TaxID=1450172 RepID=A0A6A5XGD1_9PLEO|nr:uncharacterized protein BU24DRAFT_453981 [Aaosphaeria arxii CBS 175.79]KAF2011424.1 hypothetical protein BU24DRAFT_453981 [Aaosphaeria arxii CBS 175.79]
MSKYLLHAFLLLTPFLPFNHALTLPLHSGATCEKSLLQTASTAYLATQSTGNFTNLTPLLSPNFTYIENNKAIAHQSGILHKALKLDHNRTNYDLVQCATYTELVSASGPYVIGTQIFLDTTSGQIRSVDSIVTTTNAWLFNATKTLSYIRSESWPEIPVSKRDKREVIQAAGDAYMDMWSNATAHLAVPWGTPCVRLEGSAYTGKGQPDDSCTPGIPSNHNQKPNTRRRYVIDEAMGSVSIFCVWEHMMDAADSHEFRLEGGKLRFVHTMTECGGKVYCSGISL